LATAFKFSFELNIVLVLEVNTPTTPTLESCSLEYTGNVHGSLKLYTLHLILVGSFRPHITPDCVIISAVCLHSLSFWFIS